MPTPEAASAAPRPAAVSTSAPGRPLRRLFLQSPGCAGARQVLAGYGVMLMSDE